jgi:hypothetical protein
MHRLILLQKRLLLGEIQIMNIKVYPNSEMIPTPHLIQIMEIPQEADPLEVVLVAVGVVARHVDLGNI